MNPAVLATEGLAWARAAQRRVEAAQMPVSSVPEEPNRITELGQGIEALDRALRYARRVTDAVSGASLPSGIDWERIAKFARRGRDALAHGDERLTAPGLGYSLRMSDGIVRQFGKARTERKWRTDELPMADLVAAIQALVDWLDKESSM